MGTHRRSEGDIWLGVGQMSERKGEPQQGRQCETKPVLHGREPLIPCEQPTGTQGHGERWQEWKVARPVGAGPLVEEDGSGSAELRDQGNLRS